MKIRAKLNRMWCGFLAFLIRISVPVLVTITPLRRMFISIFSKRNERRIRQPDPESPDPLGIQEDKAYMGLAIINTIDRSLSERYISPNFVHSFAGIIPRYLPIEPARKAAKQRFKEETGYLPPSFIVISPTKACNLSCKGCYADSAASKDKLNWQVFDRILQDVKAEWGERIFVISGGEPFAYRSDGRSLLDITDQHDDCLFMSYTNGTLINDKVADRLAENGNFSPAISVEGWRERTDDRRGEGVFDQVLKTMGRLRERGVPFGVSLTATRHNAEEILSEDFIEFLFKEQGAAYGWIFHYMPIGRSYTIELMPSPQQRLWMWRRSWEIIREKQIFLADFWNHGTLTEGCISAGRDTGGGYMYIDWHGHVTPCVFVPYSPVNINEIYASGGTLSDAWKESFFARIRQWQAEYRDGNGKPGNLMMPCPIRDHNAAFRSWVMQHEPDPVDHNAVEALMDRDYARGMDAYDLAYQELSDEVWQGHYLRPDWSDDGNPVSPPDEAEVIKG